MNAYDKSKYEEDPESLENKEFERILDLEAKTPEGQARLREELKTLFTTGLGQDDYHKAMNEAADHFEESWKKDLEDLIHSRKTGRVRLSRKSAI